MLNPFEPFQTEKNVPMLARLGMPNRRRSERFDVALPIWLKDGHGGERTLTTNVSSHGLAVVSTRARPLRQYVELEIALPQPRENITVTAVVARHASFVESNGHHSAGLGLDFFLFDARAKNSWQDFLHRLRTEGTDFVPGDEDEAPAGPSAPSMAAPDEAAPEGEDEDDRPTFIIKPRDLGRLWAFFRGELTKGRVRIETPVEKAIGAPVELLVVHPGSKAEWSLDGVVADTRPQKRAGRPVLEIDLVGIDPTTKTQFRNFVATGHGMIEEEIDMAEEPSVAPKPEPPRLESVVIDLDSLDDGDLERLPSDLHDLPPRFVTPSPSSASGLVSAEMPAGFDEDEDPTVAAMGGEASLGEESKLRAPSTPVLIVAPPLPIDKVEEAVDRLDDATPFTPVPVAPSMRNVFASFFEEAAEASVVAEPPPRLEAEPLSADAPPPPIVALGARQLEALRGPDDEDDDVGFDEERTAPGRPIPREPTKPKAGPPPLPPTEPMPQARPPHQASGAAGRPPSKPPGPAPLPAAARPAVRAAEPVRVVPAPASAIPVAPETSSPPPRAPQQPARPELPDWVVPRSTALAPPAVTPAAAPHVEELKVVRGAPMKPTVGPYREPTPSPPPPPGQPDPQPRGAGQMFDYEEGSSPEVPELAVKMDPRGPPPPPTPRKPPPPPPAPRRAAPPRNPVERDVVGHKNMSTAGDDPDLDRSIGLARARVVRSPHSVTACYRLSMLLMRRGDENQLDEALDSLKKVMTLEPNHPGAHHKIAELLARRGDYGLAAEHLSRARRLGYRIDPDLERIVSEGAKR